MDGTIFGFGKTSIAEVKGKFHLAAFVLYLLLNLISNY